MIRYLLAILIASAGSAGQVLDDAQSLPMGSFAAPHIECADRRPESVPSQAEGSQSGAVEHRNITIYYGLNDSHSRSWAQVTQTGLVGVSYFERYEGSDDEGVLLYKQIFTDGSETVEPVASGVRLEKSVLLFDVLSNPHIFAATSSQTDQIVTHHFKNDADQWQSEVIVHFYNEGGEFIYELSGDTGPDYSFHLLILKTRSDIDSDDFMDAWMDSHLYHLTDVTGEWERELIHTYDMAYTYDMYIKTSSRQDIKVDEQGFVHVTFSEQLRGQPDPSRLLYATNRTGSWEREVALDYDPGTVDDAGWFPSLCLDNEGIPHISCMYIDRVPTYSATSCDLLVLTRVGENEWLRETVARHDDGYYGGDGRNYTGALSHLVFDSNNTPHIIFSDVASTHWPGTQRLNVGNIRYAVLREGIWEFTTVYRQPNPDGFFNATEMFGMCLLLSESTNTIRVIGEELVTVEETDYSCTLLNFNWEGGFVAGERPFPCLELYAVYPNPFWSTTTISYSLEAPRDVRLSIYNLLGQEIRHLRSGRARAGSHTVRWDGLDDSGLPCTNGPYVCRIQTGEASQTCNLMLIR